MHPKNRQQHIHYLQSEVDICMSEYFRRHSKSYAKAYRESYPLLDRSITADMRRAKAAESTYRRTDIYELNNTPADWEFGKHVSPKLKPLHIVNEQLKHSDLQSDPAALGRLCEAILNLTDEVAGRSFVSRLTGKLEPEILSDLREEAIRSRPHMYEGERKSLEKRLAVEKSLRKQRESSHATL